jgi:hypothetical protein
MKKASSGITSIAGILLILGLSINAGVDGFISGYNSRMPKLRTWTSGRHATFQAVSSLKQMSPPDKRIINILAQLPKKVSVFDVATKAGISIDEAENGLVKLSSVLVREKETGLQVNSKGEITYQFPKDIRAALRRKSFVSRWQERWDNHIAPFAYRALRVVFGFGLVVNVMAVWGMVFAVTGSGTKNKKNDKKSNDRYSSSSSAGVSVSFSLRDVYDVLRIINHVQHHTNTNKPSLGSLESIFSYVFGDGNPNKNIEQVYTYFCIFYSFVLANLCFKLY